VLNGSDNLRAFEMKMSLTARRRGGITLIEAVLSILIVSIMMVSVLQTLGSSAIADRVHAAQRIGPALASQLMAEILATEYEDAGGSPVFGRENGEPGSHRKKLDDVDDYDGWSSSPAEDRDGSAISGLSGWTRSVSVQWVDPSNVSTVVNVESGLKRIVVTVTDSQGRTTTVTGLRGSSSAYDYSPGSSTTYVNWVGVTLQVGPNDNVRMFSGVNPLNCVPIPGDG
jgi:type II secretory pathway pseudopilin PulG